jgi:hypothetical protein
MQPSHEFRNGELLQILSKTITSYYKIEIEQVSKSINAQHKILMVYVE